MTTTVEVLKDTTDGLNQVQEMLEKADAQQGAAREHAIMVINDMCDALQAGADIVSQELSATIMEYNELCRQRLELGRSFQEMAPRLQGFFERLSTRLSSPSLRLRFHQGGVCGELHALGDRLAQPLGSRGTSPFWESLAAFFSRSTTMSKAIHGLVEGERHYLDAFVWFLNEARDRAEQVTVWGDPEAAWASASAIVELLRERRKALAEQVLLLRSTADAVIGKLH